MSFENVMQVISLLCTQGVIAVFKLHREEVHKVLSFPYTSTAVTLKI
jgi:hypothetical protein